MSDFDLIPVDGGDPIHLPPGETVLGRGPLLRVSDKRVSRNHGLLENLNGCLRLKPTHLNPCFVQTSLTDDPRPLQRDSWHLLHDGDLFSLLPGQLVYRVAAVGGGDRTPRNSQLFEEGEEELPVSPKPDVEPAAPIGQDRGQTPPQSHQEDAGKLKKTDSAQTQEEDDRGDVTPRKRVLPAWMMAAAAAAAPRGSASSLKVQSSVKRTKRPAAATSKRAAAKPAKSSSPEGAELREEGAELSEEEMPKKKRRRLSEEDEEEAARSETVAPSTRPQSESSRPEVSDESARGGGGAGGGGAGGGAGGGTSAAGNTWTRPAGQTSRTENEDERSKNGRQATGRSESVGSNGGSVAGPAPSRRGLRAPCPYGKDCYRKNPLHFQECSHPGDTDYEEEEEEQEEEEDRPECPYGTDCYRKNPLHRKEFKHTKKPARTTRTRPSKTRADDDEEDEDSGDDDSFINDDSEDVGEDSDYVPPDSDDSGKEDIRGLQREAKAFLKKRK